MAESPVPVIRSFQTRKLHFIHVHLKIIKTQAGRGGSSL